MSTYKFCGGMCPQCPLVPPPMSTGVVTGRARRDVLCTYMTAYTIYPTSEEYATVCKKLIAKYPNLKDTQGKTKYVSMYLLINIC